MRIENAALEGSVAIYQDGASAHIQVSINEVTTRRRFAVAHALGHHVLGHGARRDGLDSYSMKAARREREANRFALALLMPRVAFDVVLRQPDVSVERLAQTFQVAEVALVERLKNLRII